MTLYAVFSDIHANYPALLAAARDARALARREDDGRVEFICLGDVVDYGPQPNECVAWVRRYAAVKIQGNHDRVAGAPLDSPPIEIEPNLWPIVLWTRAVLSGRNKRALREWRHQHGASALLATFTAFHSDPEESDAYINNSRLAGRVLRQLHTPYGLFGHTHIQGYYAQAGGDVSAALAWPSELQLAPARTPAQFVPTNQWFALPAPSQQAILNPGSIGQPRQYFRSGAASAGRDYRAAYLVLRQHPEAHWEGRFQRVAYPIQETVRRMRQHVRWDGDQAQIHALLDHTSNSQIMHPFTSQLNDTLAAMPRLLPALLDQLVEQLVPPDSPPDPATLV